VAVYFHCGERIQDAVQILFPKELKLESVPKKDVIVLPKMAGYSVASEIQPNAIVMRRAFDLSITFIQPADYSDARTFYNKFSVDDQQPVVLTRE
jgi:FtsZ-interacting cell division protein YlmF